MCHRLTDGWHHVAGGWHHIIMVDGSETSLVDGAELLINEKNRFTDECNCNCVRRYHEVYGWRNWGVSNFLTEDLQAD